MGFCNINSLRPSDAYMRLQIWPSMTRIMACRLVRAKAFTEPMMEYCYVGHKEKYSGKILIQILAFSF